MTEPAHEAFQRGYVAAAYLLGRRGVALLDGLATPSRRASALASALGSADRNTRAAALAPELAALTRALEVRRLG